MSDDANAPPPADEPALPAETGDAPANVEAPALAKAEETGASGEAATKADPVVAHRGELKIDDEDEDEPKPPALKPNYVFLAVVSVVTLALDLGTKFWASSRLQEGDWAERRVDVIQDHVAFVFARNKGGAWGLLQEENELVRRPFFVLISIAAIAFIVSLYRRLTPNQTALKWGLPLVLGGALGNLVDRIRYGHVVDFIDFRASWVGAINGLLGSKTDHWPTFNVADIAIVVGVWMMAVDMFQTRKSKTKPLAAAPPRTGDAGS